MRHPHLNMRAKLTELNSLGQVKTHASSIELSANNGASSLGEISSPTIIYSEAHVLDTPNQAKCLIHRDSLQSTRCSA